MTTSDPARGVPGFQLHGNDAGALQLLTAWLEGTRLAWPGAIRINVSVGDRPDFAPDDREVFRQPSVTIQAGPDSGTVRIEWESAPAIAIVHPTAAEAELWLSPDAVARFEVAERGFLLVMLIFLMRRLGWYHVHGAALIDPRGRGWLIAGDSHCGKSTTTALLATRGWQIGTDDIGFLVRHGELVASLGVRSQIALRPGGRDLLGRSGGIAMVRRDKTGFWPEELGGSWAPTVTPEIIAFPRLGERTSLTPARARTALAELVKWSLWVLCEPVCAQDHLDALGTLARQSRCFDLTLGPDLFDHPDLLEELVP